MIFILFLDTVMDLVRPKWLDMTMAVVIVEEEVVALGVGTEEDTVVIVEVMGEEAIQVGEGVGALGDLVEATKVQEEDSKVEEIEGVDTEEDGGGRGVTEEASNPISTK